MRFVRITATGLVAAALVGSTFVLPASAAGPEFQRSSGCVQQAAGGATGGNGGNTQQTNRSNSEQTVVGVISAAISNVGLGASALNNALNGINLQNVQVVCLNDALNQNDLRLLNNVLSNNTIPVTITDTLNNNNVLTGLQLLNGARIVAVDLGNVNTPVVYILGG